MPLDDITKIQSKLDMINDTDIKQPGIPMAVYLQEAHDTLTFLDDTDKAKRLTDVGLDPQILTDARAALPALRFAQSQWYTTWSGRKPDEQKHLEDVATALRDSAFSSCRWNLRRDNRAQEVLDRIVEGEGVADLIADLEDIASLIETKISAFDSDKTFDAPEVLKKLRETASDVRVGLSEFRTDDAKKMAVKLRDRVFTHFDDIFSEIRAAGRHAYRDDDDITQFRSSYERRKRGKSRAKKAQPPAEQPIADGKPSKLME